MGLGHHTRRRKRRVFDAAGREDGDAERVRPLRLGDDLRVVRREEHGAEAVRVDHGARARRVGREAVAGPALVLAELAAAAVEARVAPSHVDAEDGALGPLLAARVDGMVARGMVQENRELYAKFRGGDDRGIFQGIGVKEFRRCFEGDGVGGREDLERAVAEVKANTSRLAKKQRNRALRWLRGQRVRFSHKLVRNKRAARGCTVMDWCGSFFSPARGGRADPTAGWMLVSEARNAATKPPRRALRGTRSAS